MPGAQFQQVEMTASNYIKFLIINSKKEEENLKHLQDYIASFMVIFNLK